MKRTIREEFEIIKKGLLGQGARSTNIASNICMYRGTDGKCCGIGFLLEDDEAAILDEDGTMAGAEGFFEHAANLNPDHTRFYEEVQQLHDIAPVNSWPNRLNSLEEKWCYR